MYYSLYEIDSRLAAFEPEVDEETGEILNLEEWEQLNLDRDMKIEGLALQIKDDTEFLKALEDEKKALESRIDSVRARRDKRKDFLASRLNGEKFKTTRCAIGWRKTSSVDVFDLDKFKSWAETKRPELLRVKVTTDPDKTAISNALKAGETVEGARIVERNSMTVK